MKRRTLILVLSCLTTVVPTTVMATVGYQFNGIGQYELGMSGAVVAAPGDAMTVISNPAGLSEIRPQGDASAELFNPSRTASFGQGKIGSHTNVYGTPALGWMVPISGNRLFLGGGFFGTAGLGVNYLQSPFFVPSPTSPSTLLPATLKAYSSISMMIAALGIAWRPTHRLSLGVALDMANENVSFQETESGSENGMPFQVGVNFASPASAYGIGVTIGALYQVNSLVTLGATYRSPLFFTPLTWQEGAESVPNPVTGGIQQTGGPGQYSMQLNYPQEIALGIALHPGKRFLVSLQGQWFDWRSTLNTVTINGPWNNGAPLVMDTNWRNVWVGAIGLQYHLSHIFTVRAGYSHGSSPVGPRNLYPNLLAPAIVQNQVSVGATENLGRGWQLVEAYMHAFPASTQGEIPGTEIPISASLAENAFGVQVNYLF
ncbi:outer membrane protein transport protein [Acidithiobacillus sp. AMEEHan]|uniref:OmpP1/FadL family transporter n=1 Tax=Acidithiobacillus sp. AMEEHan TaxID=2994951 RepID=UPI0027E59AAF|nr:outer membrane protein transport protein [Acidithiobacillus sp. AMEEHan]